jgi:hypothetical protein
MMADLFSSESQNFTAGGRIYKAKTISTSENATKKQGDVAPSWTSQRNRERSSSPIGLSIQHAREPNLH